jgi:hypothetical protein
VRVDLLFFFLNADVGSLKMELKVWLVTDTNIVEEILELKQNIMFMFFLDIEERKNMTMLLSLYSVFNLFWTFYPTRVL